jgi:uncharacterized protein YggE
VGVGAPISIVEAAFDTPVYDASEQYARDDAAAALVPTPIESGELDVVVRVNVTFEIT